MTDLTTIIESAAPKATGMMRGLLEKGGPRVHALLALLSGLVICGVLVAFAWAKIKGVAVSTEYLATLGVFSALVGYIWTTGKNIEEGPGSVGRTDGTGGTP